MKMAGLFIEVIAQIDAHVAKFFFDKTFPDLPFSGASGRQTALRTASKQFCRCGPHAFRWQNRAQFSSTRFCGKGACSQKRWRSWRQKLSLLRSRNSWHAAAHTDRRATDATPWPNLVAKRAFYITIRRRPQTGALRSWVWRRWVCLAAEPISPRDGRSVQRSLRCGYPLDRNIRPTSGSFGYPWGTSRPVQGQEIRHAGSSRVGKPLHSPPSAKRIDCA